uniref:alpha-N-acetylgalactosaminide alpha-2,6-sialyltransferase n=1 Tax=Neogobius melanostomus TaxID=47308 RepID=A0A8C6UJ47_9GOBI
LPAGGVPGMSYWEEASWKAQDTLVGLCLCGLVSPRGPPSWRRCAWIGKSGHLCSDCCPRDPAPDKFGANPGRGMSLYCCVLQKCESSLWNVIKQDPELRDKFIPDIRMFVHNGSISMSEWNRLSHFNNPFGFMDYSHDGKNVMAALNLIPKPKNPLLPPKPGRDCISCAVVGTGGVLWKSRKGREIDSHDYVFRVNGAAIKGYEEDVGNRTDVYVHTSHSITTSKYLLKKYNYTGGIKYVMIPEGMRDFKFAPCPWRWLLWECGGWTRFYVLHMDFLRYTRNRFLMSRALNGKWWPIVRPTNGAFMVFLALQLCDKVDAYGFITDEHKKYSNYYYERGANTRVIFYANHDYYMERDLWKTLHELKVINLYQGEPVLPGDLKAKTF